MTINIFLLPTETLRKYPVLHVSRMCVKDYKILESNITIEKGTSIIIPTYAIHRDEKFYPDPRKFDPSRFCNENSVGKSIIDRPYLPFGDGPRYCIGQKMAKLFVKIGICSIIQQYHVDLDDRHIGKELKFSTGSFQLTPANGVHLKFRGRE